MTVYFIVDVWSIRHGCPSFSLFFSFRHSNSGSLHGTQASEKFGRYEGVKLAELCLKERGQAQAITRRRIANFTHALISIMQAKILRTVRREQRRNIQRGSSRSLFFVLLSILQHSQVEIRGKNITIFQERNRLSLVLIQDDKFIHCREIYKILTPESVISLCLKGIERFPKNCGNWSGTRLTLHYLKWPGKGCGSF